MNIEKVLHEEITDEFRVLKDMSVGTDEYKAAVDGVAKLVDRAIEIERLNLEHEEKQRQAETDERIKALQMTREERDRIVKNCISVASIIIPSIITVWGTIKSIKFEETGTITTIMGRGFINKLLPKK